MKRHIIFNLGGPTPEEVERERVYDPRVRLGEKRLICTTSEGSWMDGTFYRPRA